MMAEEDSTDVLEGAPPADAAADTPAGGSGDVLDKASADEAQTPAGGDVLSGDDATADEGVPDQYTFEPPEGVELDEAKLDGFKEVAKELGLTQKQFADLAKYDIERSQAAISTAVDEWNNRVQKWREDARADKEFGGDAFAANVKAALSVVEKFGDADFKALLKSPSTENAEGLAIGNHPAVLRFLNRIGKAMGDPDLVLGDDVQKGGDTEDARLKRLYPSMFKDDA